MATWSRAGWLRKLGRGLRNAALGLGALFVVPIVFVHVALWTAPARDFVRREALQIANRSLDGRVELDQLESLSIFGVRLRGIRVLGRSGERLASASEISAHLNPFALAFGRVSIIALAVRDPYADLGAPLDAGGGLLGVFPKREPAAPAPAQPATHGLEIALHHVRVTHGRFVANLAGARYEIRDFDSAFEVGFGSALAAHVEQLRCELVRDQRPLATLRGRELGYGTGDAARARLEIHAAETELTLDAELGARDMAGAQSVNARLALRRLSAQTLQAFGLDASALTAPIDFSARATGSTHALELQAGLDSAGGHVDLLGTWQTPQLVLTLRTDDLVPQRFTNAGLAPLAGKLVLRGRRDPATGAIALGLELPNARYAGIVLPRLSAAARRAADGKLWLDRLVAEYPSAKLEAKGHFESGGPLVLDARIDAPALAELPPVQQGALDLEGALRGQLHLARAGSGAFEAQSDLQLTQARYGTQLHASVFQLKAEAHGPALERPALVVELHSEDLQLSRTRLPRADVTLAGGPERYFVAGRFADRGGLRGQITRDRQRIGVDAQLSIAIEKGAARHRLRAQIARATYDPAGPIQLGNLELTYRGATVRVAGLLDPKRQSQIRARVRVPEVAELTELWMERPVRGSLALDADAAGSLRAPRLRADAHYRARELFGVSDLALDLHAQGDLARRRLELELDSRSHAGRIELAVKSRLGSTQLGRAALERGQHDVTLRMQRLRPSELEVWPHGTLIPRRAELSGEIHATGSLATPTLETDLSASLDFGRDAGSLRAQLRGGYQKQHIDLALDAEDRHGPLLRTRLRTDLTRERWSRDPSLIQRVLEERAWDASVWLGSRRIEDLPLLKKLNVPKAALPALVSAQIELAHEPGREPAGKLQVHVAWQPSAELNAKRIERDPAGRERCGVGQNPELDLALQMHDGALHSEATARLAGQRALVINTESHAPIDAWFRGAPTRVRPAGVAVRFDDLSLGQLPIACEFVDGRISGHAEISRALTEQVSASLELKGEQIAFRGAPPFDAHLAGRADKQLLNTELDLVAAKGSAQITGKLPLNGRGLIPGIELSAPMNARVIARNMDLRSLLGPVPNVRASSGTLDADLALQGSIEAPRMHGQLLLRDATVTLAEVGQRVERVSGTLRIEDTSAYLDRLLVHDRDGKAQLTGRFTMRGLHSFAGEVQAKADDFPVRKSGVMLARFNGAAKVTADVDEQRSKFGLTLREARIELSDEDPSAVQSLRPNADIRFVDETEPAEQRPAAATPAQPLTFDIDASQPFWVTRSDFSVLVSTKLEIRAAEGPVSITGTLDIARGYVSLIGQMFDIESGHVMFTGGREVEPTLDLVASRRVPGGSKVSIKATGTLQKPELAFFIDDAPVTAGEALAAATGSRGGGSDSTVQQQMSSMASGLAAGVLTLGARRELGEWMPVLSIDAGDNGPSVRAGIQADRFIPRFLRKIVVDAYVEGMLSSEQSEGSHSQDSNAAAQPAALVELRFPHSLVGEAQYGPGERWSVDVGWEP